MEEVLVNGVVQIQYDQNITSEARKFLIHSKKGQSIKGMSQKEMMDLITALNEEYNLGLLN